MRPIEDTTVLITGANTGIGRATATELARRGATLVLACRSESKTLPVIDDIKASSSNDRVGFLRLDLADLASVREAAGQFLAEDRPLHVLLNNAGLAGQRGTTAQGFELAFGTNHLGHFLLTQLLLARLVESGPARIVNVSSMSHLDPKGIDWDAVQTGTKTVIAMREYGVSKLANVLFTQELARRLDPAEVTAFSLHPGVVSSDVWRRIPGPALWLLRRFQPMVPVEQGATASLYAATEPGIEAMTGTYFDENAEPAATNPVATPELAAELWERSEAWVEP